MWETHSGCRMDFTFQQPGMKYVRLTVTDGDGDTNSRRRSFNVTPSSTTTPTPTPTPTPDATPGPGPRPGPAKPRPPRPTSLPLQENGPGAALTVWPPAIVGHGPGVKPMTLQVPERIRWARLMKGLRLRVAGDTGRTRLHVTLRRPGSRRPIASRRYSVEAGARTLVLHPRRRALGRRRNCTLLVQVRVTRPGAPALMLRARIHVRR